MNEKKTGLIKTLAMSSALTFPQISEAGGIFDKEQAQYLNNTPKSHLVAINDVRQQIQKNLSHNELDFSSQIDICFRNTENALQRFKHDPENATRREKLIQSLQAFVETLSSMGYQDEFTKYRIRELENMVARIEMGVDPITIDREFSILSSDLDNVSSIHDNTTDNDQSPLPHSKYLL